MHQMAGGIATAKGRIAESPEPRRRIPSENAPSYAFLLA